MAIPSAPVNLVQVTWDFNDGVGGSDTQVTHNFMMDNGFLLGVDLANDFFDVWGNNQIFTANVILEQCRVRRVQTDSAFQSDRAPVQGNQGASSVPINTAMLVRKDVIGVGGRQQGRMFVPGISPGNVNYDGTIPSNIIANLQPIIGQAYNTMIGIQDLDFACTTVYNRDQDGKIIDFANNNVVTSWTLQPKLATQRRRMRR